MPHIKLRRPNTKPELQAESDWKFFEPERYYQYKALVERTGDQQG
jgi:hypothetical protein